MMDFDRALECVGGFGRIQQKHFVVLCLQQLVCAFFSFTLALIGKEPRRYWCKDRPSETDPCTIDPPCGQYEYSKEQLTVVSEWDLVCGRENAVNFAQSLVMAGCLVGVLVLGWLADRYGRVKALVWGIGIAVVSQMYAAVCGDFNHFMVTRFLVGFFSCGGSLSGSVLIMENIPGPYRAFGSTVIQAAFACGIAIFAAMGYFIRDWRHLTLATCFPMAAFLFIPWIVPESARWLCSAGKTSEAEDILLNIGQQNGLKLSRADIKLSRGPGRGQSSRVAPGVLAVFKYPVIRRRMLYLMVNWFSSSLAYFGLTMSAGSLGQNVYLTFALSGLVEIPAYILSSWALNRYGRRRTLAYSTFLGSFACLSVILLPRPVDGQMSRLQTWFALLGKMGISAASNSVSLYSTELLPTSVRSSAVGICVMAARVGGITAPLIAPFGDSVAYLVFGISSLVSGVLSLLLPESLSRPLSETIEDIEKEPA